MVIHIVLLQVATHIEKAYIEQVMDSLGDLRSSSIPQIKSFSYGENNSPEGLHKGFNYAFSMQFESLKDRDIYLEHPDHIKIAEQIKKMLHNGIDSVLVFDY